MTNNGSNTWDVSFAHISWFERLLKTHTNVLEVSRHHDLVFEVDRKTQQDHLTIFCCNEYTMGLTMGNVRCMSSGPCISYTLAAVGVAIRLKLRSSALTLRSACTSQMKCRAPSGEMISGLTIEKIKTEIQSIAPEISEIAAVYGFGSFFRSSRYHDIDILVVASPSCKDCLATYYKFRHGIPTLITRLGVEFDITFLTSREYQERPLLEMDDLICLFSRTNKS